MLKPQSGWLAGVYVVGLVIIGVISLLAASFSLQQADRFIISSPVRWRSRVLC